MSLVTQKELNDEFNALAQYVSNRELHPEFQVSLFAASIGGIIGRNREAGILDDATARRMLASAFMRAEQVVFPAAPNEIDSHE